jgi:hypothetical protein
MRGLEPGIQTAPSVINPRRSVLDARINPRIKSGDVHDDLKAQRSYPGFAREAENFACELENFACETILFRKRSRKLLKSLGYEMSDFAHNHAYKPALRAISEHFDQRPRLSDSARPCAAMCISRWPAIP